MSVYTSESALVPVKPCNLRLGDKVRLFPEPYGWGTVVKLVEHSHDGTIHIVRPYIHIEDFSYTGGVLHYFGSEVVRVSPEDSREMQATIYSREQSAKGLR